MKLNHKNKTSKFSLRYLIFCYILLISIILTTYVLAPAGNVCSSASPCSCGVQCNDGFEDGNGYNTVDDCFDGFQETEYVWDINATDLDGSTFTTGDTVRINGAFKCRAGSGDSISFAYTNYTDGASTVWRHVYSPATCNNPNNLQYYSTDITLDNVAGTHSVRVIITPTGGTGLTCGSGADPLYSDTDDISFEVVEAAPPALVVQSLDSPSDGDVTTSTLIDFNFTAVTQNQIDNCTLYTDDGSWSPKNTVYNVQNNTQINFTMSLTEGTYTWNVYCYDNESNIDYYDSNYTLDIDLTQPSISITAPANNTVQSSTTLTVDLSHSDSNPDSLILNVNGTNETVQTYSGPTGQISKSGLSDGTYTYFVYANDSAGNINQTQTRTIIIDATQPGVFDLISPADNSQAITNPQLSPLFNWNSPTEPNFANYTLQISTDNTFSTVNHTRYVFNNVSNSSYQFDDTLANNVTWYWRVTAYDIPGNSRTSSSTYSYITNTSDLIVTLISPPNNFANNTQIISLSYIPQGAGLDTCILWGNFSGTWQKNQTNSTIATQQLDIFDPLYLTDGEYVWNVECNNSGGSTAWAINNYTFYFDTLAPAVNFSPSNPADNTNQSSTSLTINVTHTESLPAVLILSWNSSNESYSYSGSYTEITKSSLADGTYSYYVWLNDTAGNSNQTETRIITIDSTPPSITNVNVTPSYGTNQTTFNITAAITDTFSITSLTQIIYPNGAAINYSMNNSGSIYYYEFTNQLEGVYNISVYANDSLGNENFSSIMQPIIDMTPPSYSSVSELEDPLSGNKAQVIRITVTDALTNVESVLISYNGTNYSMTLESGNTYNYTWQVTNLGMKNYSFFMNDSVNNWNSTPIFNFTINDSTLPSIKDITYTPAATDDLDPNITINITANVTDRYGLSTVLLQYRETNQSNWSNVSMTLSAGLYNGSFTPLNQNNYTFRIWADDTSGNINVSANTTLGIFYDWTWTRSPVTFTPSVSPPGLLVDIGTLTITNTGDYGLQFAISRPASQPDLYYNDSNPFSLPSKSTKQVEVTAGAPGVNGNYDINMTIDAVNSSASPSSLSTDTILVVSSSSTDQLFAYISEYDPSVERGQYPINITAKIMNVGGATAYNVTSNWTIPSDFLTVSNLTVNFSSIAPGVTVEHALVVMIHPSATLTSSALISFWANSSSGSYSSDSKYISINEPGQSSTPTPPPGGGGSGTPSAGGGAGVGAVQIYRMPEYKLLISTLNEIEILRGTTKEFTVDITNEGIGTLLSDIELEIKGFKAGYIRIQPDVKKSIGFRQTKQFGVIIDAPRYMRESKYELDLLVRAVGKDVNENIAGIGTYKSIKESKKITLIIHEVSEEDISCLIELENNIENMKKNNFNIIAFKKLINKAKLARTDKDYKRVKEFCDELSVLQENAYAALEKISELKTAINESEKQGYDVSAARRMLQLAIDAFERGNFNKAVERLREAELSLSVQKTIERMSGLRNFLKEHWLLSLVILILLSGSGIVVYKVQSASRISDRLKDLAKEEQAIMDLMKQTQTHYFIDRIMGSDLYKAYMEKYRKRMAGIQHKLVELQIRQTRLLNKDKKNALKVEADKLMEIMKSLQRKYYEKKIIDKESYRRMFYEFRKRHAEISKESSTLEQEEEEKESSAEKILTDPRSFFYLHNGNVLKSLAELLAALKDMDHDTFAKHVSDERNDLSRWIEHTFENKKLADEIANEKTKEDIINILDIYLSKY